jgi:hypothetical protein
VFLVLGSESRILMDYEAIKRIFSGLGLYRGFTQKPTTY